MRLIEEHAKNKLRLLKPTSLRGPIAKATTPPEL